MGVAMPSGGPIRLSSHVASTGQQARNRNAFVEVFPVQTDPAQLDLFALRRACIKEAGNKLAGRRAWVRRSLSDYE
jgi:hypothetical protein